MTNTPQHFILDGDGVLWHEGVPVPGLQDFISTLARNKMKWVLVTNNARYQPAYYVERFRGYGIDVSEDQIITSAQIAAARIQDSTKDEVRVCLIGDDGLRRELESVGAVICNQDWQGGKWTHPPTHVVVGFTKDFHWATHAAPAHSAIFDHGAEFVATNKDTKFKDKSGATHPANGGAVAYLEHTTGQSAVVCGKPEPAIFEMAMERMGATPESTVVIGDSLDTDILGGKAIGAQTWLVYSGATSQEQDIPENRTPDRTFHDVRDIATYLSQQSGQS